jgi:hypothetical protein
MKIDNGRTWRTNAEEFADLDQGEGWAFAVLVACSVQRAKPGSQDRRSRDDLEKVSAKEFAQVADTSADRVLRYLDAWNEAAKRGWVTPADRLNPTVVHQVALPEKPWRAVHGGVYFANKSTAVAIRGASPERKAEVARELLDEPEVRAAYGRQRNVSEGELREAYDRVPPELRNESLGAPTGVAQHLAGIRDSLRVIHETAVNPRVDWSGYKGAVAEELRRISRQAELIADIVEDPKRATITDEDLELLLRDAQ